MITWSLLVWTASTVLLVLPLQRNTNIVAARKRRHDLDVGVDIFAGWLDALEGEDWIRRLSGLSRCFCSWNQASRGFLAKDEFSSLLGSADS
mmetsp:Transcript_25263/g.59123  ORF Transcript_25263/g.59123 Transcript_25263/m.59123 type:complete len:92 (-) Transcript_25263:49-324(-)